MPQEFVSMESQLKVARYLDDAKRDNYEPVRQVENYDIKVDGTAPVTDEFNQWSELNGVPSEAVSPSSPIKTVAVMEFTGSYAAATLDTSTFFGAAALTNGLQFKQRKNGILVNLGSPVKTIRDLEEVFDEVVYKTDTAATPNHTITARMLFSDQDGIFMQLIDTTTGLEDAFQLVNSDNLSAVGNKLSWNIHGYGFIAKT